MTLEVLDVLEVLEVLEVVTTRDSGGAQETVVQTALRVDPSVARVSVAAGPDAPGGWSRFDAADAASITLHDLPSLRRSLHPLRDLRALIDLYVCFRSRRPDVVHTHSSKAGVLGRVAARAAGVPVIHTVHGWSFASLRGWRRSLVIGLERMLARFTTRIVVVSDTDRRDGINARIGTPEQYVLIRSGVALDGFRTTTARAVAREALGIDAGALVIGSVGRLAAQKDPLTMVEAFARIAATHPHAVLVMAGSGPLAEAVSTRAYELRVADRVRLLGERRDVADVLRAFDVFVLSSRWEGLPRSLVEAMAAGLPVVATSVNGVPEIVEDGRTGLLVPPGDAETLARTVARLLDDDVTRRRLGTAAAAAVGEFDVDTMARRLEHVYVEARRAG